MLSGAYLARSAGLVLLSGCLDIFETICRALVAVVPHIHTSDVFTRTCNTFFIFSGKFAANGNQGFVFLLNVWVLCSSLTVLDIRLFPESRVVHQRAILWRSYSLLCLEVGATVHLIGFGRDGKLNCPFSCYVARLDAMFAVP